MCRPLDTSRRIILTIIFCVWNLYSHAQIKERYAAFYEYGPKKNNKPVLSFRTLYDKKGKIIEDVQKMLDNWGDYNVTTSKYTYEISGRKKTMTVIAKNKDAPETKSEFAYVYTDQGYEEVSSRGKKIYYLNEKQIVVKEEYYQDGVLNSQTDYVYDNQGRLLKEEQRKMRSADNYRLNLYTYIDSMKQRTEHREYTTTDSIKTISDYLADLNERNKPIKSKCITDNTIEIFTYDHFGNLIDVKTFNSNNQLIMQYKAKYNYWSQRSTQANSK